MNKISFMAQDYQEMEYIACGIFYHVLATYEKHGLNSIEMLKREDIQQEIANRMVDDYIYTGSTHPLVQEMAKDAGIKNWADEDEDAWNENCHLIYTAMRAFLIGFIKRHTFSTNLNKII